MGNYILKRFSQIQERLFSTKSEIISLLRKTGRSGISDVISWLEDSDFFDAPASNKHNNFPGGLAEHSLNVYHIALDLFKSNSLKRYMNFKEDSIIIASLLHDVCKVNLEPGESCGNYHGDKSVDVLKDHGLLLTLPEELAIRYHMGPGWSFMNKGSEEGKKAFKSYSETPLVGIIQYADSNATVFLER